MLPAGKPKVGIFEVKGPARSKSTVRGRQLFEDHRRH
jgi:hypothetical protein